MIVAAEKVDAMRLHIEVALTAVRLAGDALGQGDLAGAELALDLAVEQVRLARKEGKAP